MPWQTHPPQNPAPVPNSKLDTANIASKTQPAAGAHHTTASHRRLNTTTMSSDADTTYQKTTPAVSSRALKCYTACYDGKLEEVKRVVNQPNQPPLDVNAEIHGGTAFAAAVQNGHLEIVRFLCSIGADVDRPIHDGATPVFIAAYRGYVDIVKFLIEKAM